MAAEKKIGLAFSGIFLLALLSFQVVYALEKPKFAIDFGALKNFEDYADGKFTSFNDYYSVCEGQRYVIPVNVKNTGSSQLDFTFSVDREKDVWLKTPKSIRVSSQQNNLFFLSVFPPVNSRGTYVFDVDFVLSKFDARVKKQVAVLVKRCADFEIAPVKVSSKACGCRHFEGNFSLLNKGDENVSVSLELVKPSWLDLDANYFVIEENKNRNFLISGDVPCENLSDMADVSVRADSGRVSKYYNFSLDILDNDECGRAEFSGEGKHVFSRTNPVSIIYLENIGTEKSSYLIVSDSAFVSVNPSEVVLEPNEKIPVRIRLLESNLNSTTVNISAKTGNSTYTKSFAVESKEGKIFSSDTSSAFSSFADSVEKFFNYYKYYIFTLLVIFIPVLFLVVYYLGRKTKKKKKSYRYSKRQKNLDNK